MLRCWSGITVCMCVVCILSFQGFQSDADISIAECYPRLLGIAGFGEWDSAVGHQLFEFCFADVELVHHLCLRQQFLVRIHYAETYQYVMQVAVAFLYLLTYIRAQFFFHLCHHSLNLVEDEFLFVCCHWRQNMGSRVIRARAASYAF